MFILSLETNMKENNKESLGDQPVINAMQKLYKPTALREERMATMTIRLPDGLKKKLQKTHFINWGSVAQEAIEARLKKIELIESIASKSKLTKKDAEAIGEKVKEGIARHHGL